MNTVGMKSGTPRWFLHVLVNWDKKPGERGLSILLDVRCAGITFVTSNKSHVNTRVTSEGRGWGVGFHFYKCTIHITHQRWRGSNSESLIGSHWYFRTPSWNWISLLYNVSDLRKAKITEFKTIISQSTTKPFIWERTCREGLVLITMTSHK